jgi:alkyl hydroperoxide reductase subunit D
MSLAQLIGALPDYARDQKLNLDTLANETILSEQQKWGCFLASAYATGEPSVVKALKSETDPRLSIEALVAVKRAASIMAMNTVYYRAINMLQNHDYRAAPANLSMTSLTDPGIDKIDFELWALSVSAVQGCASCLNAHEAELHKRSVSTSRVLAAIRIAAVVNAASSVMRAEAASAS